MKEAWFPFFMNIAEKNILLIGGGAVACRRLHTLLQFTEHIQVIAPVCCEELKEMAEKYKIYIQYREFREEDLEKNQIVLDATNDEQLHKKLGAVCAERGILLNVAADKSLCDFYFPGIVKKDEVVVGVTASGKHHKLAKQVTEHIKQSLGE